MFKSGQPVGAWKPSRYKVALFVAIGCVVLGAVILPIPIAAWIALAVACALWPNPEKQETLGKQLTQQQDLRARKMLALGKQLRSPTSTTVGFGDPGNDPFNPEPQPWPPVRLSSWWSVYGALATAVTAFFVPIPWFCPPLLRAVLSGIAAFVLFQGIAAGTRAGKDQIEPAPAALWNTEIAKEVAKDHIAGICAAAAGGAVVGILFFGPTLTFMTRGFAEAGNVAASTANPMVTPATSKPNGTTPASNPATVTDGTTPPGTTASAAPAQKDTPEPAGVELPAALLVLLTLITALTTGAWVFTKVYTEEQSADWYDYIEKRDKWIKLWEGLNLLAPLYVTTVSLPHGAADRGEEPSHELVAFQTPAGYTWAEYAKFHEQVQASLGKPFVLFRPMPQRDDNGGNIPGTSNPGEFTITYPAGHFPDDAHLDPETDQATRRFLTEYHFQHAFAAAKAGTPLFITMRPLHRPQSPGVLYETIWRLPREVAASDLAAKHLILAQGLKCEWLRVGTRGTDEQGRQLATEEVTIVYGDNPEIVELRDPNMHTWLQTLTWDAWWRSCKIINRDGYAPRLTETHINHRDFTEVTFALPPGIELETTRKAVPSLSATSGFGYIEIEPDSNPSMVHLVAGLTDPLNDQYLFVDYADQILHDPVAGSPQLDWAVGVGADGELMYYKWDAELPHLLVAGSSGMGKALGLDTPIPTASGSKPMRDMSVGDVVFDERGEPCNVVAVTEVLHGRPCYEVEFDDGTVIVADAQHEWFTETDTARASRSRRERRTRTVHPDWTPEVADRVRLMSDSTDRLCTIDEIAAEVGGHAQTIRTLIKAHRLIPIRTFRTCQQQYGTKAVSKRVRTFLYPRNDVLRLLADRISAGRQSQDHKIIAGGIVTTEQIAATLRTTGSRDATNHSVRVPQPVQFPGEAGLPIDPYVLGVWLGDGSSWHGSVTSADPGILEEVEAAGYTVTRGCAKGEAYQYGVLGLQAQLRAAGLLRNKHIPNEYLVASEKQRWALLQGLFDTDGSVDLNGVCEFSNTNKRLAEQVHELISGLGIKTRLCSGPAVLDGKVVGTRYRMAFTTTEAVARLDRKSVRQPVATRETREHRYIVDVRPIESVPVRCIQVDSPSHQYLASRSFIPTHNSVLESSMLTQLLHNNHPHDLEIRCVEPKNELQAIQDFVHVTRFVDFTSIGRKSLFAGAADMLEDTVNEMERRYQLMTGHPGQPRKLSEARLIAMQEPPPPGYDRHPLDMPYIIVIIEECGDIFRAPTLKSERTDHERVLYYSELLARKARAAGIYMVVVTQYPTNQNIPSTIKQQCRRLGLAVNGQIASMVIIDEPGLEKIEVKGRGLMTFGKGYRGFRALYLRRPSEDAPDLPDDFVAFTDDVERHGGGTGAEAHKTQARHALRPPQPPAGIWADA